MDRFSFSEKLGLGNIFPTVHSAVEFSISEGDPTAKPAATAPAIPSVTTSLEEDAPSASIKPIVTDVKHKNYAKLED